MRGGDVHLIARRLRRDDGFTLVEMAVGAMLATLLLATLGTFLMGAFETGAFTEGQSATLNDVRNVMQKVEKELRGADSLTWAKPPCPTTAVAGDCVVVGVQTPTGAFETVRYTYASNELRREEYDPDDGTWGTPLTMVQRVANTDTQPVFSCDSQSTLLRITIDLHIEATPESEPTLNVTTSVRPRNFPKVATCPTL